MITGIRNAFTRYALWINALADMPRYFAVIWTLLLAMSLLFVIAIGIARLVRVILGPG